MVGAPLWSDSNDTLSSSFFEIPPGKVGLLFGIGFADEIERDTGDFVTPQAVCVHKVYLDADNIPQEVGCGGVLRIDKINVFSYLDEEVLHCGEPWQLTKCSNIGIIGVPGTYYLKLNGRGTGDETPQVYLEILDNQAIAPQVNELFFD